MIKHATKNGYTITTTYQVALVKHTQVDEYDHDGTWLSSSVVMEEANDERYDTRIIDNIVGLNGMCDADFK